MNWTVFHKKQWFITSQYKIKQLRTKPMAGTQWGNWSRLIDICWWSKLRGQRITVL